MQPETHIAVVQMGGLGDIVLTSALIGSLRGTWPDSPITLICRDVFSELPSLFPSPPTHVHPVPLHPHRWATPEEDLIEMLVPIREGFGRLQAELLISADYKPTWFTTFAAASIGARRFLSSRKPPERGLAAVVLDHFELSLASSEGPPPCEGCSELERYSRLARFAGAEPAPFRQWDVAPAKADKPYLVCCPFGSGSTVKHWPARNFIEALGAIHDRHGLEIVLTGDLAESEGLQEMAKSIRARVFTGGPGDIHELAHVIAGARLYVGNDTGPMHLAQACGVPAIAIFGGGGFWQAYRAWGNGAIGVIHPLPCFGCEWNCTFGHGVCVEKIPASEVIAAANAALADPGAPPRMIELSSIAPAESNLIADASTRYRESERDRSERLETIIELRHRLDRLQQEADRRADGMRDLTSLVNARDHEIARWKEAAAQRLQALDEAYAEAVRLRGAAEERLDALAAAHAELERLRETAEARSAALDETSRAAEDRLRIIGELGSAMDERSKAIEELLAAADERSRAIDELRAAAETNAREIQLLLEAKTELQQRIREFENESLADSVKRAWGRR